MILLALLACAGPDPAADRAAFAALACDRIGDAALRDECRVFAAKEQPDRVDASCAAVRPGALHDECWFIAVDAREMVGAAAARACGRTGKFVAACHANAISREVSRLPAMEEGALVLEIERIIGQFRRARPGEAAEIARRRVRPATPRPPP